MAVGTFQLFVSKVQRFDKAMLVTPLGPDLLRSRPMSLTACSRDGHLWFVPTTGNAGFDDLAEVPVANVALQGDGCSMSVTGTVRATSDPRAVTKFWPEAPGARRGHRDRSDVTILDLTPTYAEFWDESEVEAIQFVLATATGGSMARMFSDRLGKCGPAPGRSIGPASLA